MKLFLDSQRQRLIANGQTNLQRRHDGQDEIDFKPVVKLFTPDGGATWLLTEIIPDEPDLACGLCDLGLGSPELGTVSLTELASVRGRIGLPIERDRWFEADRTLSQYADEATKAGHIRA